MWYHVSLIILAWCCLATKYLNWSGIGQSNNGCGSGTIQPISYISQTEQHSTLSLMLLHLGNVTYIHNPSGHAKLFPVSGPTGHLKKTRAPGFIFFEDWSGKKMVHKQQYVSWRVTSEHKATKRRHLCSQNKDALMVKATKCRLPKQDCIWLRKSGNQICMKTRNREHPPLSLHSCYSSSNISLITNIQNVSITNNCVFHEILRH